MIVLEMVCHLAFRSVIQRDSLRSANKLSLVKKLLHVRSEKVSSSAYRRIQNLKMEKNLKFFPLWSKLNFYPCKMLDQGKQMSLVVPTWRLILWKFFLANAVVYAVYINFRLLEICRTGNTGGYASLGIHLARSVVFWTCTFWAYDGFVLHDDKRRLVFNWTHATGEPFK